MATLRIPATLRQFTDGQGEVIVQGGTVGEALCEVAERYPSLKTHLFTPDGQLRSFVNLFLNDEDIRHLDGVDTVMKEADRLIILPSIAGGSILTKK
ncbi:MAG TPA: ubiquitin-like small modifier protein 1 [Anaerolineaceae bacterium]|nr:ubiquitin-like small modifier protein 1 [Anaerolineaceae bacterium]